MPTLQFDVPAGVIAAFCLKWKTTGTRGVIAHKYRRADMNEIRNVFTRDVPALVPQLESILKNHSV